ncbi:MAG: hypothetical protein ACLT4C_06235 [Butyricicoccus sp.]
MDLAEQQAKKNGKIYAYGEIIHNMHEIERMEKLGVYTAYALRHSGWCRRAHSGARCTTECIHAASSKKCEIFDAACPFCGKYTKLRIKESADGRLIVILGSAGHPEVVGIQGWCGESVVLGARSRRSLSNDEMENKPISLAAQTMLTVNLEYFRRTYKKGVQTSKFLIQYVKRRMSASRRLVCCRMSIK